MAQELDWNVAVYCANEGQHLRNCLLSAEKALAGKKALLTIIVNGSSDNSLNIAREFVKNGATAEVFEIKAADKANAINQFIYALRSPARAYGEIDGYATIGAGSFHAMDERFRTDKNVVALTGVAVTGRSMLRDSENAVKQGGRLFGQFHAFRHDFFERMVARQIRLPVGLYRGDGLLGSMAAHDLDCMRIAWANSRIAALPSATFSIPVLSALKPRDIQRQFRRKVRQMRGRIENAAIKSIIYERGYEGLPAHADTLIDNYLSNHKMPKGPFMDRIFLQLALRDHATLANHAPASLLPVRVI